MDFFTAVQNRYSCRNFSPKKVERADITEIMDAVLKSPSACNSQPWKFIIVDDAKVLPELKAHLSFNKFCQNVTAFAVMVQTGANLTEKLGNIAAGKDFTSIDHGIAVQTLCLAAAAKGIDSCILGMFSQSAIKKLLKVPKAKKITLIVALGYSEQPPKKRSSRKDAGEVISYNSY